MSIKEEDKYLNIALEEVRKIYYKLIKIQKKDVKTEDGKVGTATYFNDFPFASIDKAIEGNEYRIAEAYYTFKNILLSMGFYDCLVLNNPDNADFLFFFLQVVLDGNVEIVKNNIAFLGNYNVCSNTEQFLNIFKFHMGVFKFLPLEDLKEVHELILREVRYKKYRDSFGTDFMKIIKGIAYGNFEVPINFSEMFISTFHKNGTVTIEEISNALLENAGFIIDNVRNLGLYTDVTEMSKKNDKVPKTAVRSANISDEKIMKLGMYTLLIDDDVEFLKNKFNIEFSDLSVYIVNALIGGFHILYERLESIEEGLFKYLVIDNSDLFIEILSSFDCDITMFNFTKPVDELMTFISELCSKIFFAKALYEGFPKSETANNYFVGPAIQLLMISMADLTKKGLLGEDTNWAYKCKQLVEDVELLGKTGRISEEEKVRKNEAYTRLKNMADSVEDREKAYLYLLDSMYFDVIHPNFIDFLLDRFIVNNRSYKKCFIELLKYDPNLIDVLNLTDDKRSKNITERDRTDLIRLYKKSLVNRKYTMASDLNMFLSYKFYIKFNEMDYLSTKSELLELIELYDSRYHSRLTLSSIIGEGFDSDFTVLSNTSQMLDYFKYYCKVPTEIDFIHLYIYFLYLENNIAHDTTDNAMYVIAKEKDYFRIKDVDQGNSRFRDINKPIASLMNAIRVVSANPNVTKMKIAYDIFNILNTSNNQKLDVLKYLRSNKNVVLSNDFQDILSDFLVKFNENKSDFNDFYMFIFEKEISFDNKGRLISLIIQRFYTQLFDLRKKSNHSGNVYDLNVTKEESALMYKKYGYLISISLDPIQGKIVLYLLDVNYNIAHSVHMVQKLFPIDVDSVTLNYSDFIDNKFEYNIYCSKNERVPMKSNSSMDTVTIDFIIDYIKENYPGMIFFESEIIREISTELKITNEEVREAIKMMNVNELEEIHKNLGNGYRL